MLTYVELALIIALVSGSNYNKSLPDASCSLLNTNRILIHAVEYCVWEYFSEENLDLFSNEAIKLDSSSCLMAKILECSANRL